MKGVYVSKLKQQIQSLTEHRKPQTHTLLKIILISNLCSIPSYAVLRISAPDAAVSSTSSTTDALSADDLSRIAQALASMDSAVARVIDLYPAPPADPTPVVPAPAPNPIKLFFIRKAIPVIFLAAHAYLLLSSDRSI